MLATLLPVLEQLSDGIHIFNAQGQLIYANESAAQSLGFSSPAAYARAHRSRFRGLAIVTLKKCRWYASSVRPISLYAGVKGQGRQ